MKVNIFSAKGLKIKSKNTHSTLNCPINFDIVFTIRLKKEEVEVELVLSTFIGSLNKSSDSQIRVEPLLMK